MLSEERTILQKVCKGDIEAFEKLYDFYVSNLFRFVFLKISNKEIAEEIVSDVFIKFWQYIQTTTVKQKTAKPILYKIARNLIIDFYRKKELATEGFTPEMLDQIEDTQVDFLKTMINAEEVAEVMQILGELKDEYQEVILLRFVEDLTIEEIAKVMSKKNSTIRVLLHRATKALRQAVSLQQNN